jgi:hypothetical protein
MAAAAMGVGRVRLGPTAWGRGGRRGGNGGAREAGLVETLGRRERQYANVSLVLNMV